MSSIRDIRNPWRDQYRQAKFRSANFFVENDSRGGGRRPAIHVYPKRNKPYSEDMGRAPVTFQIRGYLIGPYYLDDKDRLITALEADGPGTLQVPLPYLKQPLEVLAGPYTITERREAGGYCELEMEFSEYGTPGFANTTPNSSQDVKTAAADAQAAIQSYVAAQMGAGTMTNDEMNALMGKLETWGLVPSGVPSLGK